MAVFSPVAPVAQTVERVDVSSVSQAAELAGISSPVMRPSLFAFGERLSEVLEIADLASLMFAEGFNRGNSIAAPVGLEVHVGVVSSAASAVVEPASFAFREEAGRTTGMAAQVGLVGSAFGVRLSGAFRRLCGGGRMAAGAAFEGGVGVVSSAASVVAKRTWL